MEPLNQKNELQDGATSPSPENADELLAKLLQLTQQNKDTIIISASPEGKPVIHHTKNLYPIVRHTILIAIVLLCATLIIFLMHQNGKSIYDNGL